MTAFNVYNGDGSQTQFPITFDYFNVSEIEVLLWNSAVSKWQQKTNTVDYNITSTNINFVAAPAAPTSGITGNVLILRKTEVGTTTLTDAQAVYSPGSAINAADLNKNQIQALRAVLDLRDSNMPIHGKTWADSSQETRLYSDLNMTGREIKNVGKIKFESFAFTEGGIEVETDTKDIPTQAELALKDDITNVDSKLAFKDDISSVDAKLALNVTNEEAKLLLKDDVTSVNNKLALKDDITNVDTKLALKDDITSVNAKLSLKDDIASVDTKFSLNVTNEDAKLALKDDITSVNTKLALNVINEDAKLALKDDILSVDAKLVNNVTDTDSKLALKDDITNVDAKLASNVVNEDAKLATKADLSGGKLLVSQLPDIAVTDFLGGVANQSSMLALAGQKGDWCTRTDDGKIYIITGADPTLISNWTALTYPAAPVTSVAGRTGVVTLSTSDIAGLGTAAVTASTNYATAAQGALADSATQPGDLDAVATSGSYFDLSGLPTLGTAAATDSTAYATSTQGAKADSAVQPIDLSVVASSGDYSDLTNKPNLALKADLVGSVLDTSQLPELAITKFCGVVANENDMLALGIPGLPGGPGGGGELGPPPGPGFIPEYGDWCIRSDNDKVYIVTGPDATLASDWTAISYPAAPVTSVAGRTGVVTLSTNDVSGLGTAATTASTNYATAAQGTKADSATQPADLAVVQADVDQNEADADTAIAAVQADVDQNEADSDAAELALSNRLNTLETDPTTAAAVAAVQADVDLNEANLATVATSGSYNDLSGKPTIPTIDPDTVIDANYVATDNNFTNADHTKLAGIAAGAEVNVVTSVASKTGAVTLVKGDVGLGNVNNTTDANKPVSTATQTALDAKADLVAGKLNTSQLPDIAIAEYKGNVTNQTAMLAVTGEKGDWVIRNDDSKVYVITGTNPSVASDWTALSYPAGFSGAYNDLSGKPTLGTAAATASTDYATAAQGTLADSATQPADLHTVATSGSYNDLSSTPTIPTNNNQLTNGAGYITSADGGDATTLDGIDSSSFLRSDADDTTTGRVVIDHNSSPMLKVSATSGSPWAIELHRDDIGSSRVYTHNYSSQGNGWVFEHVPYFYNSGSPVRPWYPGNDGTGSGLDADLLDGVQGSNYVRLDATNNGDISFPTTNAPFSNNAHSDLAPMSIRLWDNYNAGGPSTYGTVFDMYGRSGHSRHQLHFYNQDIKFRSGWYGNSSVWSGWDTLWHSGNDGAGSGLDADLLDGYQLTNLDGKLASYGTTGGSGGRIRCTAPFNTNSGKMFQIKVLLYKSYTIQEYVVGGYMYSGTNQWYSPTCIYKGVGAPDIVLGRDTNGKAYISIADAAYTGVKVSDMTRGYYTSESDTYQQWTITTNSATENSVSPTVYTVWHSGNDGSGSGLDADTLDGIQSVDFMGKVGNYWNCNNWLQFNGTHGLYWPSNYAYHVYLNQQYLLIRNSSTSNGIKVQTGNGTLRGYFYADSSNQIGLLNNAGSWGFRMDSSGNCTASGNLTAYSDIRLKENIRTVDSALEKVKSMRGVYFDRKDTGKASVGVIAQEIEKILPEVVETSDARSDENTDALPDIKTVSYGNIVGVLIEAIKEQQIQIDELKAKLEDK